MTCATCRFYEIDPRNLKQGTCTRYPPQIMLTTQGILAAFPGVQHHQNCGEHKLRITIDATVPATGVN